MTESVEALMAAPFTPFHYRLKVKRRVSLLSALLDVFCGDAFISFDGDLSLLNISILRDVLLPPSISLDGWRRDRDLKRAFVPIEEDTKSVIQRYILPRVGLRRRVNHVEIIKHGIREFGAYDGFSDYDAWVSTRVEIKLLESLVSLRILRSYGPARPHST